MGVRCESLGVRGAHVEVDLRVGEGRRRGAEVRCAPCEPALERDVLRRVARIPLALTMLRHRQEQRGEALECQRRRRGAEDETLVDGDAAEPDEAL